MTEREWEEEGAGGEPAEAGVRCEDAACFWGFGCDVGVAILVGVAVSLVTRIGRFGVNV